MELISVIIPVYNVEKYLNACLDSLVNQTYKELEIILVDDGSTDNSGDICDNWAKKDSRIKVFHKKNGGQSTARNMGLDVCTGKYIGFVDSDDYVSLDMFHKLHTEIAKHGCDMVCCAYKNVDENGNEVTRDIIKWEKPEYHTVYSGEEYLKMMLECRYIPIVWDKLYTKEFIGKHRFNGDYLAEDTLYIYEVQTPNTKIVFIPDMLYYYVVRGGSTTHGFNEKYYTDKVRGSFEIENEAVKKFPKLKNSIKTNQLRMIASFLTYMPHKYIREKNKSYLYVLNKLKENKQFISKSNNSLVFKTFLILFLISKHITKLGSFVMIKLLNKIYITSGK